LPPQSPLSEKPFYHFLFSGMTTICIMGGNKPRYFLPFFYNFFLRPSPPIPPLFSSLFIDQSPWSPWQRHFFDEQVSADMSVFPSTLPFPFLAPFQLFVHSSLRRKLPRIRRLRETARAGRAGFLRICVLFPRDCPSVVPTSPPSTGCYQFFFLDFLSSTFLPVPLRGLGGDFVQVFLPRFFHFRQVPGPPSLLGPFFLRGRVFFFPHGKATASGNWCIATFHPLLFPGPSFLS